MPFSNDVRGRRRYLINNILIAAIFALFAVAYIWVQGQAVRLRNEECAHQREHVRNLNDWVSRLRSVDEYSIPRILPRERPWVKQRIKIYGDYLYRESNIDFGACGT